MKYKIEGSVNSRVLRCVLGNNEVIAPALLRELLHIDRSPFLSIQDQGNMSQARDFRCDIFNMTPFLEWARHPHSVEEMRAVVFQIAHVMEVSIAKQLPLKNIALESECVYYNPWKACLQFVYLPVDGIVSNYEKIKDFFIQVIRSVTPKDAQASEIQTLALNELSLNDRFNPQVSTVALKTISSGFPAQSQQNEQNQNKQAKLTLSSSDRKTINLETLLQEKDKSNICEDGEKPTTDLGYKSVKVPTFWLIHKRTGEKVRIKGKRFVVGKSKKSSYQVKNTTTVSRSHAIFSCDESSCYIEDDNSLNGTFVNTEKLASGIKLKLHDGDSIRMSDEVFNLKETLEAR